MTQTLYFYFAPRTPKGMKNQRDVWGGIVRGWLSDGKPDVDFGLKSGQKRAGQVITVQAHVGQLIYSGRITSNGTYEKKYGLAWRNHDGKLVACDLSDQRKAQAIHNAGGYNEPEGDCAAAISRIARINVAASPRAFEELCNATTSYMEAHLLAGAPKVDGTASSNELCKMFLEILAKHSSNWPNFQDVLQVAEQKFREWDELPLV
jgi:hypothetical protein